MADANNGYFRDDYHDRRLRWELKDGDWQAMPGLDLLDTRGHSRGHQSAMITLPDTGTVLLPFDAGDLAENFAEEILPGFCYDDAIAMRSLRRINELRVSRNATLFLFHDPVAIQTMRLAPLFYT
jgi:N-acyl homoserine lactone hydrolase